MKVVGSLSFIFLFFAVPSIAQSSDTCVNGQCEGIMDDNAFLQVGIDSEISRHGVNKVVALKQKNAQVSATVKNDDVKVKNDEVRFLPLGMASCGGILPDKEWEALAPNLDGMVWVQHANKCGDVGDSNRVFDLRGAAATEQACKAACYGLDECKTFSRSAAQGWCIGCKEDLSVIHSGGGVVAYRKQRSDWIWDHLLTNYTSRQVYPVPAVRYQFNFQRIYQFGPGIPKQACHPIVADEEQSAKKCGSLGDANRVFVLRAASATEEVCKAVCSGLDECVAYSRGVGDVWDSSKSGGVDKNVPWCIGCKVALSVPSAGAVAYKKVCTAPLLQQGGKTDFSYKQLGGHMFHSKGDQDPTLALEEYLTCLGRVQLDATNQMMGGLFFRYQNSCAQAKQEWGCDGKLREIWDYAGIGDEIQQTDAMAFFDDMNKTMGGTGGWYTGATVRDICHATCS